MRRYLRALAAFYIRLTFKSIEVYEILEPLMKDYRKLRIRHPGKSPSFSGTHGFQPATLTCGGNRRILLDVL